MANVYKFESDMNGLMLSSKVSTAVDSPAEITITIPQSANPAGAQTATQNALAAFQALVAGQKDLGQYRHLFTD